MPQGETFHRPYKLLLAVWLTFALAGCATLDGENETAETTAEAPGPYEKQAGDSAEPTVVAYDDYKDPLQFINRPIFKFNHFTYRYFLSPLSRGYQRVVPEPVDNGLGNFFHNLREPLYFLNNLFQIKPIESGTSILRLGINSTVGLLGVFDPAAAWWGLERQDTTFGDTLSRYGVGYGAYIVIPLLGPSDLRDGTSITFDYFTHPLHYTVGRPESGGVIAVESFRDRVPELSRYTEVVEQSQDPYIFVRNLYLQGVQRDAEQLRDEPERKQQQDPQE